MKNKFLPLGILFFLVGGAGWFLFVILSALTLGAFRAVANISVLIALIGFAMILFDILRRFFKRK